MIKLKTEVVKKQLINDVFEDKKLHSNTYKEACMDVLNKYEQQLSIPRVSKSLNADELITSLGTPDVENEYLIKPDKHGKWQIEHKHVGSGEPLKQWLTGKP